jgi:hypothetical protein
MILEGISYQIGRWGGSLRVNEGMWVNHPFVTSLRLDHDDKIHTTCNLEDIRWQERKCGKGGREVHARGIAKETGETLEM